MTHSGSCFCGAVTVEVTGEPAAMGYCHCRSCRSWSGGPVNAFTLWQPAAVRVTRGAEHLATFQKTPLSQRQYCAKCGGHLMAAHPPIGLVDVFAATLPTLPFKAGVHVNYGLVGLKTHAKCILVVREESGGIRRYVHVATGNYNSATARIYAEPADYVSPRAGGSFRA